MSIKSVLEISEEMTKGGLEALMNEGLLEKYNKMSDEFDENFEAAKQNICAHLNEQDVAKYIRMITEAIVSRSMANGKTSLVKPFATGELQEYTDSVVLIVIGGLIMEGVL